MSYVPITPFGRPVDATLIEHQHFSAAPYPETGVNKWDILRELTTARKALGLSHRSLSVLQTLFGFHPETILDGRVDTLIVFPSNAAICERMHGIACSTMRRHLTALIDAGLILRRDSPNGKRYVKRYGTDPQAFGFDLTPLVTRYVEICELADATRAADIEFQRLKRTVSLMRRDLAALSEYGLKSQPELRKWDALNDTAKLTARALRRNLCTDDLCTIQSELCTALEIAKDLLHLPETAEMNTSDAENEQHIHNSNKDTLIKEEPNIEEVHENSLTKPITPLAMVLDTCKEFKAYVQHDILSWSGLVRAAQSIRPMMGITGQTWDDAVKQMGPEQASVVLIAMLERFEQIKSPGAYLRHLSQKAGQGTFSCGPMIASLMRRTA